jgi:spoIIIJ-associated protein
VEQTAPKTRKPRPQKKKKPQQKRAEAPKPAPVAEEEKAAPVVEEGPIEDRTEQINAFLTGLLERLDCQASPVIQVTEDNIYQVELVGENLGALIGRRGETLDAIQQLTNYAVNNNQARRVRIHIDAENYRAKREESLQRLARKTAGKAMKYRRNMMLEPMNAYERHVIHAALQEFDPCISTYSTGTEPNRRVVVAYSRSR